MCLVSCFGDTFTNILILSVDVLLVSENINLVVSWTRTPGDDTSFGGTCSNILISGLSQYLWLCRTSCMRSTSIPISLLWSPLLATHVGTS